MSNTISSKQLVEIVKSLHNDSAIFTILLGAGASSTSSIETGEDLIKKWRVQYDSVAKNEEEKSHCQEWHNKPNEYATLFEHNYKTPSSRRQFIEKCIEGACPHWGYLYLVHLVEKGLFNTILTTNFDDLINEAFHSYTADTRPMICSNENGMASFKITSDRPKVIKLHGDYLFDDLKNTRKELISLGDKTNEVLATLSKEYGLIVIGYGGNDECIMGQLAQLLKDNCNFPHGIYWCLQEGANKPARLDNFSTDKRLQFVTIEGFDEVMGELHSTIFESSPEIVSDPFNAFAGRLSRLLTVIEGKSKVNNADQESNKGIIVKHAEKLAEKLRAVGPDAIQIILQASGVGALEFQAGHYDKARNFFLKSIQSPHAKVSDFVFLFECLRYDYDQDAFDTALEVLENSIDIEGNDYTFLLNGTLSLIHAKKFPESLKLCELLERSQKKHGKSSDEVLASNKLNMMQIKVHRGDELSDDDKAFLTQVYTGDAPLMVKFACHVLSEHFEEAIEIAKNNKEKLPKSLLDWPLYNLLPKQARNRLKDLVVDRSPHYSHYQFKFDIALKSPEPTG